MQMPHIKRSPTSIEQYSIAVLGRMNLFITVYSLTFVESSTKTHSSTTMLMIETSTTNLLGNGFSLKILQMLVIPKINRPFGDAPAHEKSRVILLTGHRRNFFPLRSSLIPLIHLLVQFFCKSSCNLDKMFLRCTVYRNVFSSKKEEERSQPSLKRVESRDSNYLFVRRVHVH